MNDLTIAAFDKFAEQYVDLTFLNVLQYELNRFISMIPKKGKIIDLGCGSGRDVQYFLDYGFDAVGVDGSENMITEAKKRVPDGDFRIMHLQSLNFPKESFDAGWALDSISYLKKEEAGGFLSSLHNILKMDAIIFISARQGEGEKEIEFGKLGNSMITIAFYSQEELENLLTENGFEVINSFVQDGEDFTWINVYAKKK